MIVYRHTIVDVKKFLQEHYNTLDFNINNCATGHTFNLYSKKLKRLVSVVINKCSDNTYCVGVF